MALGWLYLYSRYRKAKRKLRDHEADIESAMEICRHCGYERHRHADDEQETCPIYLGHNDL